MTLRRFAGVCVMWWTQTTGSVSTLLTQKRLKAKRVHREVKPTRKWLPPPTSYDRTLLFFTEWSPQSLNHGQSAESGLEAFCTERDSFRHETAFSNAEATTAVERGALTNGGLRRPPDEVTPIIFWEAEVETRTKGPPRALQLEICRDYTLSQVFNSLHFALAHLNFFLIFSAPSLTVSLSLSGPRDGQHHQHPIKDNSYLWKGPDEDPRFSALLLEAD